MDDFIQGQLVAVRDRNDEAWSLRVVETSPRPENADSKHACWAVEAGTHKVRPWKQARPAEDVWPELFFDRDSETMDHMRRMRRDLGVMRRQIEWLCACLQAAGSRNGKQDCPLREYGDCLEDGCAKCWEGASLEAAREGDNGSED